MKKIILLSLCIIITACSACSSNQKVDISSSEQTKQDIINELDTLLCSINYDVESDTFISIALDDEQKLVYKYNRVVDADGKVTQSYTPPNADNSADIYSLSAFDVTKQIVLTQDTLTTIVKQKTASNTYVYTADIKPSAITAGFPFLNEQLKQVKDVTSQVQVQAYSNPTDINLDFEIQCIKINGNNLTISFILQYHKIVRVIE